MSDDSTITSAITGGAVYYMDNETESDKTIVRDATTGAAVYVMPKTTTPESSAYVYGVDVDLSMSNPASTGTNPSHKKVVLNHAHDAADDALRYTVVTDFTQMPAHNLRRCVMDDLLRRRIAYYLNASDSTKKADGGNADLTGGAGDVMVEIPVAYYRIDRYTDSTGNAHVVKLISNQAFNGAAPFPAFYVSNGGATLQAQYIGAFKASIDANGKCRSVAGVKPTTSRSMTFFRTAAASNGGNGANFLIRCWLGWLAEIEYASTNTQAAISTGFSEMQSNSSSYFRYCGRTASLGNGTGQIIADGTPPYLHITGTGGTAYGGKFVRYPTGDSGTSYAWWDGSTQDYVVYTGSQEIDTATWTTVAYSDAARATSVGTFTSQDAQGTDYDLEGHWKSDASKVVACSYRGVEDPWGGCYEFGFGIQKYQNATAGDFTQSGYWFTTDSTASATAGVTTQYEKLESDQGYGAPNTPFPAAGYTGANTAWVCQAWPKGTGYIKLYDPLTYFPTDISGNNTTYLCDSSNNNVGDNSDGPRYVFFCGPLGGGSADGAFYLSLTFALGYVSDAFGCRLAC